MSIGTPEVIVCLLVALIVLGPDKLPKAARQLGKALADFRKFSSSMQDQVTSLINEPEKPVNQALPKDDEPAPDRDERKQPNTEGFRLIDEQPSSPEMGPPQPEPKPDSNPNY